MILIYDDGTPDLAEMTPISHRINRTDQSLRRWFTILARAGVPELVLVALLRSHADRIEQRGYVPQAWDDLTDTEHLGDWDDN